MAILRDEDVFDAPAPVAAPVDPVREQELARPAAVTVAPPATVPLTLGERFMGNVREGFANSILGSAGRFIDTTMTRDQVRMLREQGQTDAADRLEATIGVPQPSDARFQQGDAWNAPGTSIWDKIVRGGTSLGGQLFGGGAMSPEGFVGDVGAVNKVVAPAVEKGVSKIASVLAPRAAAVVARAAPAAGRIASSAVTQGAVQAGTDPVVQGANIAAGTQKTYDPMQTVEQAVFGAVLGAGIHGAGEVKAALGNAFQDWRIQRHLDNQGTSTMGPPTRQEVEEFANSPVAQALRDKVNPPPQPIARPDDQTIPDTQGPLPPDTNAGPPPGAVDLRGRPIVQPVETAPVVEPSPEVQPNPKGWETNPITESRAGDAPPSDAVPDEHATEQAAIDAEVQKAQTDGTIKAANYDHTSEPQDTAPAQGKVEGATEEGTPQSGGVDGGTVKPSDATGGEGQSSPIGSETGGVEPGGGAGVGGKPGDSEPTVSGQPDRPGEAKPAGGEGASGPRPGGQTVEPAPKTEVDGADATYQQALAHAKDSPSTSYIQRKMGLKYKDASALMQRMEDEGIVSAPNAKGVRTYTGDKTEPPAPTAKTAKAAKAEPAKSSTKAVEIVGGHIATNDAGHVMSDGGLPVKYKLKAQADKARDHFNTLATKQTFETVVHPDGKGYSVQGRLKEPAPKDAGGGAKAGTTEPVPKAPPEAPKKAEAPKAEPKKAEAPKVEKPPKKSNENFKHEKTKAREKKDLASEYADFEKGSEHPDSHVGAAKTARDYVLSRGKASGHEAAVLYDRVSGKVVHVETVGEKSSVAFTDASMVSLVDPSKSIVMHHNHPSSRTLSGADIGVLAYPGMKWIVAHGHNGDMFAARLGAKLAEAVKAPKTRAGMDAANHMIRGLADKYRLAVEPGLRKAIKEKRLTFDEANDVWQHAGMLAMDRAGAIDYVYTKEVPSHVRSVIDEIVAEITSAKPHADRPATHVSADAGIDRISARVSEEPAPRGKGSGGRDTERTRTAGEIREESARALDDTEAHENADLETALKAADETAAGAKEKVRANIETRDDFYTVSVEEAKPWTDAGERLANTFGWVGREAKAWINEWKENFQSLAKGKARPQSTTLLGKAYDKIAPAISMAEMALKDKDGVLRSRATALKSETLRKVADLFHAATEGVGARVTGAKAEDYHSAKYRWENKWKDQYGKATSFLAKLPMDERNAKLEQIGRLVQNPHNIKRGTDIGDAAHEITQIFKEANSYLREAGVDVGTVREGYLPRIENVERILANPTEFKARAERAYIASGVDPADAKVAAQDWLNRVTNGDFGVDADGVPFGDHKVATPSNFTKGRVLSKEADNIMGDFYHQNVRDIVPRYIKQAVGRAEWARRFGVRDAGAVAPAGLSAADLKKWREDPNGKWKDITQDLIDEGNGHLVGVMAKTVRSMTGNFGAPPGAYGGWQAASVWLRTANILGKLSYSVLTSLAEPMTNAVQTGNVKDAITAYAGLVKHWVPALQKLGDGQYLRDLASDLNIIGDHWDESSALQLTGGESGNALADKLVEKFFRLTGQAQFTNASRITSLGIGQTFLRRLAKDVESGNHYQNISRKILTDFGVRDPDGFAKWLSAQDKPTKADLGMSGKHGEDYGLALQRYVQRTVMHPTAAMKPAYANHPLGSMIFALQSFNYAFKKQVLDRTVLMAKDAFDKDSGLNAYERLYAMAPMLNLVPMAMVSYAVGEIRDAALPDPSKADQEPMDSQHKWIRAMSRTGLFGYADPLVNIATQARYQTDVATALAGPILGPVGTALGASVDLAGSIVKPDEDAEDSTARSRRVAQSAWDVILRPAMQSAVTMGVPGGAASRTAATAFSYWLADRRTRAAAVDALGGEKD